MKRIFQTLLFWTVILGACSTGIPSPPAVLPTSAVSDPELIATVSTPHIDEPPNSAACAYQWANQDLPALSGSLQQSLQVLQPEAQASAYAFGENCILANGSIAGFSAMETDFNITLQVADLTNESDLGEWIVKVMQVIESIPQQQIVGPRPGRVSITFRAGDDHKIVNFYVNQFQELPSGLSSSEIYQALRTPQ
jgi:hypothetical protein